LEAYDTEVNKVEVAEKLRHDEPNAVVMSPPLTEQ
jgi:hypothetical protein